MSDIKNSWQEVADDFGKAFTKLGKTLIRTVASGAKKAEDWANSATGAEEAATEQKTQEQSAEPKSEENKE